MCRAAGNAGIRQVGGAGLEFDLLEIKSETEPQLVATILGSAGG
jgi:hypothetical protein